jgi:hypothetical protein
MDNTMNRSKTLVVVGVILTGLMVGCAHTPPGNVSPDEAARLNRKLVRNAVSFGPGAEDGAVVPEVSSPCLHADIVDEKIEGNKLIEKHREWMLDCDVRLLGIQAERVHPEHEHAGRR